jgi:hypothetical protein
MTQLPARQASRTVMKIFQTKFAVRTGQQTNCPGPGTDDQVFDNDL